MTIALNVITLLCGLLVTCTALSQLADVQVLSWMERDRLLRLRRVHLITATCCFIILFTGPGGALSFGGRYGWDLALVMVYGVVWAVVLAIQIALLHHIREAAEARP